MWNKQKGFGKDVVSEYPERGATRCLGLMPTTLKCVQDKEDGKVKQIWGCSTCYFPRFKTPLSKGWLESPIVLHLWRATHGGVYGGLQNEGEE